MKDSILESIKDYLGVGEDDTVFDPEIIMDINTVFNTLCQLGVGPEIAFHIEDKSSKWTDFIEDIDQHSMIKTYIFIQTRLLFDPPTTSTLMTMLQEKAKEYEWRLNVEHDEKLNVKEVCDG